MSLLGDKQRRFAVKSLALLQYITDQGYEWKYGETMRSDEQAEINALGFSGRYALCTLIKDKFPLLCEKIRNNFKHNGVRNSVHQLGLAIDIHLFKNGEYLTKTEDHRIFGEWWKTVDPDARWGGDWGDGNHYSFEHNGVK